MNTETQNAAANTLQPKELPTIRRFELADLSEHGTWLLPRLLRQFPDVSEHSIGNWLRNLIASNDYLFLYMNNGVALAQAIASHGIGVPALLQELFVWVKDPKDKELCNDAAGFYTEFNRWAKNQGLKVMVLSGTSDVPQQALMPIMGRVFKEERAFVRIADRANN